MSDHHELRRQAQRLRAAARSVPEHERPELLRQAAVFEAEAHAAQAEHAAEETKRRAANRLAEEERVRERLAETNAATQRELDRQAQALEHHEETLRRRGDR